MADVLASPRSHDPSHKALPRLELEDYVIFLSMRYFLYFLAVIGVCAACVGSNRERSFWCGIQRNS